MYQVIAVQQGTPVATVNVDQPTALAAITKAEQLLGLKPQPVSMGQNGHTTLVQWTGLDLQARKINEASL
jgi:hypothetical protein